MSLLAPSADFVYGNTRLRARKAELLARADYEALLGRDLEGVYDVLARTAYRRDLEDTLARTREEAALPEALRRHFARTLGELRSFYRGRARELVDLLLARVDLHNLLALLRAHGRAQPAERALPVLIPLGPLGDAAAEEIAGQREAAAAVALLIAWRLPDADTAVALARAWPEFERTQDLAALEHTVAAAHALRVQRALADAADEASPLRELLARERDMTNALVVLRLRAALQLDELARVPPPPPQGRFLAGGRISGDALEAALRVPARADAVAAIAAGARRQDWHAPLERYAGSGDLPRLQQELESSRIRWAVNLFLRGDPLGVDVPIAYTVAKENELRNLRLIGESVADGAPAEIVRVRLLLPDADGRWAG